MERMSIAIEIKAKTSISREKVWMKYYSEDIVSHPIPKQTAYEYMRKMNQGNEGGTAVRYYGTRISYKRLFEMIEETTAAFAAMGVGAGEIVSFVSVAVPECIAAIYALNQLGATVNTIDPRLDIRSIQQLIQGSGSRFLVVIDAVFPKIAPVIRELSQGKILVQTVAHSLPALKKAAMIIANRGKITYNDTIWPWNTFLKHGRGTSFTKADYVGDATVAITYTGGTTGFPKGVMLTNDSMNAVSYNFQYAGLVQKRGDRFLGIIPVFTSYGMVCGMHMPLCMGFELIPIPRFIPTTFGKLVRKNRPQHVISTPAFYDLLMNSKEVENMDLSFLITMGSGGDTMNEGLEKKLGQFMRDHNIKYPLAQGYGMSELSAAASFCVNELYKPASVGIPSLTTTVSIFDPETGEEMDYNQEGEICVTGPSMMKGYYNHPGETAHVMRLHDDGQVWIHSGDIGYMDEDGFLFIKGRVKRMITRFDGHKVFPVTMESAIAEFPEVSNCCVIGVNDREHSQGQYPMALFQPAPGVDRQAVAKMLYDYCQKNLEERGRPVAVLAVDEIPLTGMGKNDYRALEKEFVNFDYQTWNMLAQADSITNPMGGA